ncbi:uncharacterized protein PHALS_06547 [Plasmopara halstedii]|uniref:Uncharacterized protein n=1 Tax=Plasmopara halstedii TaxID=4781 RepID=A0A0P1B3A7_PLAHL|nr:uncharacterized protein PHALS_06547 [Plasmopara halstedii]CEG48741.1 hypothetical protein PHALS_06547 [Plasmopara halstedii]|eukprot:XP_024585110.1 hypothetical protein PHALS_06547 [Plasmopara halstedii]
MATLLYFLAHACLTDVIQTVSTIIITYLPINSFLIISKHLQDGPIVFTERYTKIVRSGSEDVGC